MKTKHLMPPFHLISVISAISAISPVVAILLASNLAISTRADAQVYGYTDDKGVLILSNVPTEDRMRLIIDGTPEQAGRVWRYSGQYDSMIQKAATVYRVDAALIRAVIAIESGFNRFAKSNKGAQGLMQLMPSTARELGVANPFDAWQNIRGGTAYLKQQMDQFGNLRLALAAYNAGPNAVRRYGTVPPYRETKDYVRKIMAIYGMGGKLEILKGGRSYTISAPGAKISVGESTRGPNEGPPSRLVALADRTRGRRNGRVLPPAGKLPGAPVAKPATRNETLSAGIVFYRFTDPEGVVRISRDKPSQFPYEVLDP